MLTELGFGPLVVPLGDAGGTDADGCGIAGSEGTVGPPFHFPGADHSLQFAELAITDSPRRLAHGEGTAR